MHVPDDKRRHRFLDAMMKTEFRANWKYAGCELITARENGRVVAIAQLCAPGFTKPTDLDIIPHERETGGEILCLFTNSEINRGFL